MLPVARTRTSYGTRVRSASSTSRSSRWISHDAGAEPQVDALVQRERDPVGVVGALEHRGQQDPVVRRVRLVAEQGDGLPGGGQPLREPGGGHAGADDDDALS